MDAASHEVTMDPSDGGDGVGFNGQAEASQESRRPSLASMLYEPEILPNLLNKFMQFYRQSSNQESIMFQLRNFNIRRVSVAHGALADRRMSRVQVAVEESLEEGAFEMVETPRFDFRQLVTNMRMRNDMPSDIVEHRGRGRRFRIGVLDRALAQIEGKHGAAVMSYFSFLQHVVFINFFIVLLSLLVIVPHNVLDPSSFNASAANCSTECNFSGGPSQKLIDERSNCTANYTSTLQDLIENAQTNRDEFFSQIFSGKGILERAIFYGLFERAYKLPTGIMAEYNMSFAMTASTLACFVVSLILILARASVYFSSFMSSKDVSTIRYSIQVFGSWNFGLIGKSSCMLQQSFFRNKLLNMLVKDSRHATIQGRDRLQKAALYAIRAACHVFVLAFLGGSGYAIYLIQEFSDKKSNSESQTDSSIEGLAISFLPSFTITALYMVARPLFGVLGRLESYSSDVSMAYNIARAAVLRVASLLMMFATLFSKVNKDTPCIKIVLDPPEYCWENYIGRQMYKLVIMDFLMVLFSVFILEAPRGAMYRAWKDKWRLVDRVGLPEFDIPAKVLDTSYTQTLCWISFIFSPFIPIMTLATTLTVFFLRKNFMEKNFKISETFSSTTEVRVYFLFLLCPFLVLSLFLVGYCMIVVETSEGCGPYRDNSTMIAAIPNALPGKEIIKDIFSTNVFAPVIPFLIIYIYIQWSIAQGNDKLLTIINESKHMLIIDNRKLWTEIHRKTEQLTAGR